MTFVIVAAVAAVVALIVVVDVATGRRSLADGETVPLKPTDYTITYHANYRSGLAGVLVGESLARSVDRVLVDVNKAGRRVVFMVRDRRSIWWYLGVLLATLVTLGLWSRAPGYLIVAELTGAAVEDAADVTEADGADGAE